MRFALVVLLLTAACGGDPRDAERPLSGTSIDGQYRAYVTVTTDSCLLMEGRPSVVTTMDFLQQENQASFAIIFPSLPVFYASIGSDGGFFSKVASLWDYLDPTLFLIKGRVDGRSFEAELVVKTYEWTEVNGDMSSNDILDNASPKCALVLAAHGTRRYVPAP